MGGLDGHASSESLVLKQLAGHRLLSLWPDPGLSRDDLLVFWGTDTADSSSKPTRAGGLLVWRAAPTQLASRQQAPRHGRQIHCRPLSGYEGADSGTRSPALQSVSERKRCTTLSLA